MKEIAKMCGLSQLFVLLGDSGRGQIPLLNLGHRQRLRSVRLFPVQVHRGLILEILSWWSALSSHKTSWAAIAYQTEAIP